MESADEKWTGRLNADALPDLYEATKLARDTFARLRAHPKWPWKDQDGEGIPIEVFLDAALRKARGEA